MADQNLNTQNSEPNGRRVGGTEYSWCRSVAGGTGITVLALLLSKAPDTSLLQNALHKLQISHPILSSKLSNVDSSANSFSFTISPTPYLQLKSFDFSSDSHFLQNSPISNTDSISPFHRVLEHELNQNPCSKLENQSQIDTDVFFANLYTLPDSKWVVVLRLHTAVCDRTSAVSLLRELLDLIREEKEGLKGKIEIKDKINGGIEDLIPSGKANKPFWARGVDLLGYSLNSLRLSNLGFKDVVSSRSSEVVRLQMNSDETRRVLTACKERRIKLWGALTAAAFMAAYSSKDLPDHPREKYAVVNLVDCRKFLDPPLENHNLGFYHSAILHTHDIKEGEELWKLASKCNASLTNSINSNKHFSDMGDLNFLMCKAIENPGLTPSSSLRTSFIVAFDEPVFDDSTELQREIGLEDYVGCSSVHGVGPSIAIFDTIRNGRLDCACVYPSPLHSRAQMQELIDNMKMVLLNSSD